MPKRKLSFEEALEELENLASALETNQLSLEQAVAAYEQSQKLIQICSEQLTRAEKKVKKLIKTQDKQGDTLFELESFN